jgi:hypothetical protein
MGGEANVVNAVSERLYELQMIGKLDVDPTHGGFRAVVMVEGELIEVTGRVMDGGIAIGNFWIPKI